jgi:DNA-binding SARP family transcriptional activator
MRMDIRLLGFFDVALEGTPILLPSAKQRTLLALLALNAGSPVSANALVEELWPERDGPGARGTLRSHIFYLRRALTPKNGAKNSCNVVAMHGGYALVDAVGVLDSALFDQLTAAAGRARSAGDYVTAQTRLSEALALWRGPALDGLARGPRLDAAARRFEESRLTAQLRRIDLDLRLGRHREILPELASLIEYQPLDEGLCIRYMVALYLSERRTDSLSAYQHIRRRLVDALGLEPSERLRQVHQAILRDRPVLEAVSFA